MDILEQIKTNLNANKDFTKDFKYKIFELVLLFNKKFPKVSLDNLCSRIGTVTFEKLGTFERRGTFYYDPVKNKVSYDAKRIKDSDYDIDNMMMKAIVAMISSKDNYYGFNKDDKLSALNKAMTEMIATSIVGNEGISDYEEEILIANLLSKVLGVDFLIESYFNNDSEAILRKLVELEV